MVVWEHPDYSASVDGDFVGAFEVFEYAVEGLILDLFWQALQKSFLGRVGLSFFDSFFNHEYGVELRFVNYLRCHVFIIFLDLADFSMGRLLYKLIQ